MKLKSHSWLVSVWSGRGHQASDSQLAFSLSVSAFPLDGAEGWDLHLSSSIPTPVYLWHCEKLLASKGSGSYLGFVVCFLFLFFFSGSPKRFKLQVWRLKKKGDLAYLYHLSNHLCLFGADFPRDIHIPNLDIYSICQLEILLKRREKCY